VTNNNLVAHLDKNINKKNLINFLKNIISSILNYLKKFNLNLSSFK
jgi:hypothetical protein